MQDRGLAKGRIGIECDGLSAATLESIRNSLPHAQIKNSSNLILLIRMVKSTEELKRLRCAGQIAEEAATRVLSDARPGKFSREMVGEFRSHIAKEGADLDHFAICARGLGLATEPNVTLLEDDILYTDYGCVFEHYCSDPRHHGIGSARTRHWLRSTRLPDFSSGQRIENSRRLRRRTV